MVVRDILVYIAGPISKGNLYENIKQACAAGIALMKARIAVIVPHLTCYMGHRLVAAWNAMGAVPEVLPAGTAHEDWYNMDLVIVRRCCAVLRLPGESTGADLEVAEARKHGIPVFGSVAEVIAWSERLSGTANADGTSGGGSQDDSAIQRP